MSAAPNTLDRVRQGPPSDIALDPACLI